MIEIILENNATGEIQRHKQAVNVPHGWRVKEIIKHGSAKSAQLAVWAQRLGIPVAEFSDMARWILKKDCPFCQVASQVLKAIEELGSEKSEFYFNEILKAKKMGDTERLAEIRREIWPLDQLESPPLS